MESILGGRRVVSAMRRFVIDLGGHGCRVCDRPLEGRGYDAATSLWDSIECIAANWPARIVAE